MNSAHSRNTDFDAFVKRQQAEEPFDGTGERDDWLRYLKQLYEQIESFLAGYIKTGEITLDYRDVALNEESIGSYTARQMIVRIGRQEITLTPAGTMFFYMKGRVDVEGPAGRTRLLLVDSTASGPPRKITVGIRQRDASPPDVSPREAQWVWKIATNPPATQYIELTQDSLFQTLMAVANG